MTDTAVAVHVPSAVEVTKDRRGKIEAELVRLAPDIAATLPNGMSQERFQVVVLQALSRNPDLLDCEASSVILSVLEAAQLGLEPTGSLSRAWLIPYKEKGAPRPRAQLMIGVRGYEDLARRSGEIADVWSRVVYQEDDFEVIYGTEDTITHKPKLGTIDPTDITHVYAVAKFRDGRQRFEVMTKADIDRIRSRARASNFGPWVSDYAEMARKTCVRRLIKTLPLTIEAVNAIEIDEEREFVQPVAIPAVSRTAEVRMKVLGRGKEALETTETAAEVEVEPTPVPEASAAGQGKTADVGAVCKVVSPFGEGSFCDQPLGHEGVHRSGEDETWPRS